MGQRKTGDGKTQGDRIDAGIIDNRGVLKVVAELAYQISNGTMPTGRTKAQIMAWIKANV